MDGYTFSAKLVEIIAGLIGSLAWPTAVVILAILFRGRLADLLHRIREVTGPAGTSAKFSEQLEATREATEATVEHDPLPQIGADGPYLDLAQQFPSAAVMSAYQDIEEFIREHLRDRPPSESNTPNNHMNFMKKLAREGAIPDSLLQIYMRLRETRNAAVHSKGTITPAEAIEYRDLSKRFLQSLQGSIGNILDP
ncbi:hypothetical protein C8D77_103394 [Mesorhizobium loti]|uniref:DUF4145 domain-containing protein n=1 Tax=Rhizobium loti TaxID=381 RepID=A0A8E2WD48_RHILI|nr:hypothetical protein [Mesorhizobium loti]PWJ91696.1 hypothetical protein C8D77_103394 [Mesorhizobium loti]